jgi:hypothetical protein
MTAIAKRFAESVSIGFFTLVAIIGQGWVLHLAGNPDLRGWVGLTVGVAPLVVGPFVALTLEAAFGKGGGAGDVAPALGAGEEPTVQLTFPLKGRAP